MSARDFLNQVQFHHEHEHIEEEGLDVGTIRAVHQGREIGHLSYSSAGLPGSTVDELHVDPSYRRRGVAGRLYEKTFQATGLPVSHVDSISPSGRAAAEAHTRRNPHMHNWEG